jgi:NitT/TauT family transport system ATP-binding protein/nitrate/nitrite transport system substrate-binding protein
LLRLTDSAPAVIAHELGFFADEGVETELNVEPSWANAADKLAYEFLDAAVILPPLAFAVSLGLRGPACRLIIPYVIGLGGNTITFTRDFARAVDEAAARTGVDKAKALASLLGGDRERPVLAVVHTFSTHNLLLRYWLAAAGIRPDSDVAFSIVPPALAVEALRSGRISGFCAGAPWGEIAVRAKLGETVATSNDVWRCHPEKAFAVRGAWAKSNPEAVEQALRALLRAAKFCDAPENASYTAALLSRRRYVNVDSHALLSSLPGAGSSKNASIFFRHAATFPFRSHAQWSLRQMQRWRLLDADVDVVQIAEAVYRPDLYRSALASLGEAMPRNDVKIEGGHSEPWVLEATPSPIAMAADMFCDGATFVPEQK